MKKKLLIIGAILLILIGIPVYLFSTGRYVWIDSVPVRFAIITNTQKTLDVFYTDAEKVEKQLRFKHIFSQKELDEIEDIKINTELDPNYSEKKDIDLSELKYLRNLQSIWLIDEKQDPRNYIFEKTNTDAIAYYNKSLQETSVITGMDQLYKLDQLESVSLWFVKIGEKTNLGEIKKLKICCANLEDLTWITNSPSLEDIEITYLTGSKEFNRDFKKKLPKLKNYKEIHL